MESEWTSFEDAAASSLFFLGHRKGDEWVPLGYPRNHRPHLAYYGTTDSGKSFAIEYVLRQLARDRSAGFCLIDPHAALYWRMVSFLHQHEITDRVLFWDINDPNYVTTYDPFCLNEMSPSGIAGSLTRALLGTLGDVKDPSRQPILKTITQGGFRMLSKAGLPFILSPDLFFPENDAIERAVAALAGEQMSLLSLAISSPNPRDRSEQLVPTFRRLENIFSVEQLRLSFTQAGVNFRRLMDEGWIVLVNVSSAREDQDSGHLFTRLLVRHLLDAAKSRDVENPDPPFFLVMDEASRYLSEDVAALLAEARKFGCNLVAGMQGLEQAKLEDPKTYLALKECMDAEVVMRILDPAEKEYFTERFYADDIDFKKVKHTIRHAVPFLEDDEEFVRTDSSSSGRSLDRETGRQVEHWNENTAAGKRFVQRQRFEYDEIPTYYPVEEQLRLIQRRFSQRQEGQEQRFGHVRIKARPASEIEIPLLDPPLYSIPELVRWLDAFKATQPATLPLIEARKIYEEIHTTHIRRLRENAPPAPSKRRKKSTTNHDWKMR